MRRKYYSSPFAEPNTAYSKTDFRSRYFSGIWQKHFIHDFVDALFLHGEEQAMSACAGFKDEHLPEFLYKFYPPSVYSLVNLENNLLWLSSAESFNDPFDSYIGVDADAVCKRCIAKELISNGWVTEQPQANSISRQEFMEIRYAKASMGAVAYGQENKELSAIMWKLRNVKSEPLQSLLLRLWVDSVKSCKDKITQMRNTACRMASFSNLEERRNSVGISPYGHIMQRTTQDFASSTK